MAGEGAVSRDYWDLGCILPQISSTNRADRPYLGGGGVGPSTNTNHLIWNAVMQSRAADYYTRALVTSAVRHYPSLRASNFRFSKWSRSYCVPDEGRAVMFCNTPPELHGAVVGGDANGFSTAALYNNFISSE